MQALEDSLRRSRAAPEVEGGPGAPEAWDTATKTAREVAFELVRLAFENGASDLLLDDQENWMEVAVKLAGEKDAPANNGGTAGWAIQVIQVIMALRDQAQEVPQGPAPGQQEEIQIPPEARILPLMAEASKSSTCPSAKR